jgi:serine/threonine-protein kinase
VTEPPDPIVGTTVLGRYRIVARLAAGGMGVVYLARAEGAAGFAKPVVVKRVLPSLHGSEQMARLFIREAKILANLQHPNIVSVIDFGEEDGAYIMVLDYVRAYDLGVWAHYLRGQREGRDRLPVECVIHVLIKVLDALEYAHTLALPDGTSLDIIHADISPSNVLVDTDGQVKLLDFGIARMRGEVTKSTDSASIRGKFSYLPVEALDGSAPQVTTDVYACGVTLYELLAGQNPFLVDD